jgi:signal transduction histidine kinase
MLVALVPTVVLVSTYGAVRLGPILPLAVGLAGGNLIALLIVHQRPDASGDQPASLLLLDTAIAFAVNVSASAAVPGTLGAPYHAPFWFYLVGTVALVTAARGPRAGFLVIAASVPLQYLMAAANALGGRPPDLSGTLGRVLWLTVALILAAVAAKVVAQRVELARRESQAAERARLMRTMHDTVLQSLEAMSLAAQVDRTTPEAALAELRGTARREAARLRRTLADLADERRSPLADSLAEVVEDAGQLGLSVRLVLVDAGEDHLTPARRDALREATREALTNVAKHSGSSAAVVRVDAADAGIEVVIRDRGCGFAAAEPREGFGIRESIVARMRDAGGSADIESWPGRGTRVRLWAPS